MRRLALICALVFVVSALFAQTNAQTTAQGTIQAVDLVALSAQRSSPERVAASWYRAFRIGDIVTMRALTHPEDALVAEWFLVASRAAGFVATETEAPDRVGFGRKDIGTQSGSIEVRTPDGILPIKIEKRGEEWFVRLDAEGLKLMSSYRTGGTVIGSKSLPGVGRPLETRRTTSALEDARLAGQAALRFVDALIRGDQTAAAKEASADSFVLLELVLGALPVASRGGSNTVIELLSSSVLNDTARVSYIVDGAAPRTLMLRRSAGSWKVDLVSAGSRGTP